MTGSREEFTAIRRKKAVHYFVLTIMSYFCVYGNYEQTNNVHCKINLQVSMD